MPLSDRRLGDFAIIGSLLLLIGSTQSAGNARADSIAAAGAGGARDPLHRGELLIGRLNPDHDDSYQYRLPYADKVSYPVMQGYGSRLSHRGSEFFTVDFRMEEGTPVHSAREGLVILVEDSNTESCWYEGCGRYANFIVVLHSDGTTGEYFHLQPRSALVAAGDFVSRGALIARSGNTGFSTAPHLHFGVYRASADGTTQSIAVRFITRGGLVSELRPGSRHQNVITPTANH